MLEMMSQTVSLGRDQGTILDNATEDHHRGNDASRMRPPQLVHHVQRK